jgi:hypothetical protein
MEAAGHDRGGRGVGAAGTSRRRGTQGPTDEFRGSRWSERVPDVEAAVRGLTDRGVRFERYEGTPMATDEIGVFRQGGPPIAWFDDPAGNVLPVIALEE